jgi:hypothetical protein
MWVLLALVAFFGTIGWSLSFVMGRIHRRARAVGVSPVGALVLAYIGYLVGTLTSIFAAVSLLMVVFTENPPGALVAVAVVFGSLIGTVIGSGLGYVILWARTTRDPDYGPVAADDGE